MKNNRIHSILCTIDLSDYSKIVVASGIAFARHFGSRLTIAHSVFSPNDPIYGTAEFERGGEMDRQMTQARKTIADMMRECPIEWDCLILSGEPVEQVARAASRLEADLVVAASHGISGFKRLFIGTVVERMARNIMCPLLVLRMPSADDESNRHIPPVSGPILVASDLKESSATAVQLAVFLARSLGTDLGLAHVMESPVNERLVDITQGHYSEVQDVLVEKIKGKLLDEVPAGLDQEIKVSTHIEQGIPAEQIPGLARRSNAETIVLGARFHHSLEKLLVGSTTEAMLRHAPCAVLVVPESMGVPDPDTPTVIRQTGIIKDERFLLHGTGEGHPEQPERLSAVYGMLDGDELKDHLVTVPSRPAEEDEIRMIHSRAYLKQVAATAKSREGSLAQDTLTSDGSYAAARLAAGGLFELIQRVAEGEIQNGFALVRPPGHHAERNRAMGYCLFNNIALGAVFAQRKLGLERVLIVDWDVHHGNGTQHAFEEDPSVLFFSIHQFPHYPGTGLFTETGIGVGEGYTVNIPLSKGYGHAEYLVLFDRVLRPLAIEFNPDLILVSAGFDTHPSDPLGGMCVTGDGFSGMTRQLMEIADTVCHGRLVLALEGGYDTAVLGDCVRAVLREMTGLSTCDVAELMADVSEKRVQHALQRLRHVHGNHLQCLSRLL